jgi:hypothetical protein
VLAGETEDKIAVADGAGVRFGGIGGVGERKEVGKDKKKTVKTGAAVVFGRDWA